MKSLTLLILDAALVFLLALAGFELSERPERYVSITPAHKVGEPWDDLPAYRMLAESRKYKTKKGE